MARAAPLDNILDGAIRLVATTAVLSYPNGRPLTASYDPLMASPTRPAGLHGDVDFTSTWLAKGEAMEFLSLDRLANTPPCREPFPHLVVPGLVRPEAEVALTADFPSVRHHGSFPISELSYGSAFEALLAELRGPALERLMAEKLDADLAGLPQMITVRGRCHPRDGRVHTDSVWKVVSALLYLNGAWTPDGGRLRLLRSTDLDDVAVEVPPAWGTLIAFRRSDRSFHGHRPFEGERRVVQVNWATSQERIDRELQRHRRSAWLKRFVPFLGRGAY